MKDNTEQHELTLTRYFDAPRARVFAAWSDPAIALHWMGPRDFPATHVAMSDNIGGAWSLCLGARDGSRQLRQGGVLRALSPPECLAFAAAWEDEAGSRGAEALVTVSFAEQNSATKMSFHQASFASAAERDGHAQGWASAFDRLADHLRPSDRELVLSRLIDAPREKLYRAWTEPELLKQWFAPKPYTTPLAELDLRPGGSCLIVMRSPEGQEMPNRGVYLEIVPNERIVFTDAYVRAWEPAERPFMTVIVTFAAEGDKTRYTAEVRHWSVADRERHEAMGFHRGWGQCADQLEALAKTL